MFDSLVHPAFNLTLWNQVQSGDKYAFTQLYNNQIEALNVYGMALSQNPSHIQDAIQEVFIHFWKKRQEIQIRFSVKNYLFTALRRELIFQARNQKKIISIEGIEEVQLPSIWTASIEMNWIQQQKTQENRQNLLQAIDELSPKQREIIYLRFNENLVYEEIALLLNKSIGYLHKLNHLAISNLRKKL